MMALEAQDKRCTALFRQLDKLKAEGKYGDREYMVVLAALRTATKERLNTIGLMPVYLG